MLGMRSLLSAALLCAMTATPVLAAEHGTAAEAEALVKKAVAFIKSDGPEKAYAAFTAKDPRFTDRDLYILVHNFNGICLAHGFTAKLVGKNMLDMQDIDGKAYVRERMEMAKTKPSFWQDYRYTDPLSKKIESKSTYCEVVGNTTVCSGIYKQ